MIGWGLERDRAFVVKSMDGANDRFAVRDDPRESVGGCGERHLALDNVGGPKSGGSIKPESVEVRLDGIKEGVEQQGQGGEDDVMGVADVAVFGWGFMKLANGVVGGKFAVTNRYLMCLKGSFKSVHEVF